MIEGLTIRVHRSPAEAEVDLETPGLAGYAFGRFAWLQAWADTLGAAASVRCAIVVIADTRVRMVLPLGVVRRNGLRVLEFLGGVVTDYNAPLVDPGFAATLDASAVQALWIRIRAALPSHDTVRLLRMPASLDAPDEAGAARVPNPLVHLARVRSAGTARSTALPDSYAALVSTLRTGFVADTRRRSRRLAEMGQVSLSVAADHAAMCDVIAALKRMKSRRWRDTGDRNWFADPAFAAFYDAMGRMEFPDGRVHGSLLTVGGVPVAGHLGLIYHGRFYYLLTGWESGEWQRFGTGRLMVDALMRGAIDDGLRIFDFTVGEEDYKGDWVDTELPLFRYEAAVTIRGRVAMTAERMLDRMRARAKRVGWLRGAVRRLAGRPALPRPRQDDA